jgi:anti-anti-sigma factor
MEPIRLELQPSPAATIVHVHGALEPAGFPALARVLDSLLERAVPRVVLECSRVTYAGESELRALLDFAHLARARRGDIKCAGLPPTIEQLAVLTSNGDPLECFPTLGDALAAFPFAGATAA